MPKADAATSQLSFDQEGEFATFPDAQRVRLLIGMARNGNHELAARLLAAHPLTGPLAVNRTLFIEGLILRARGKLKEAAAKFRSALASDPSLTLVRAELSQTLVLMSDDDAAKHHLQLLMGVAPTAEEARDIKSFIDSIDARRPFKASAYVSIAPSTNINNGTSNDVIFVAGLPFIINNASKKKSGIGLAGGANAVYTAPITGDLTAVAAGGVHALQYRGSDYDQLSVSQTTELRRSIFDGYVGLGVIASESFDGAYADVADLTNFGGNVSAWSLGPRLSLVHAFAPDLGFIGDMTVLKREYAEAASDYDGWSAAVQSRLSKIFATDLTGFVSGGIERYRTEDRADLDYWDGYIGAGVYKEMRWGISATLEADLHRRLYDADFPTQNDPRRDTRLETTASLWKRDFNFLGYAPVIEYNFDWNDSNIPFYQFTGHTVDFRLTKEF